MKKSIIFSSFIAALVLILAGCEKEGGEIALYERVPTSQALLKVNYASVYASNPSVQLTLNGTRVSSLITARTPFPGGGLNTGGSNFPDYLSVSPGTINVSASIPKKGTNTDSVVLFNNSITLQGGKHYTAHVADTGANTKVVLLEDDLTLPDTGRTKYRFINLMPNVASLDLYFGNTKVASNIAYGTASDYFTMPVTNMVAQAWTIRPAGADISTTPLATYTSTSSIAARRIFTIFALGYSGQTSTVMKPYVSFLYNR